MVFEVSGTIFGNKKLLLKRIKAGSVAVAVKRFCDGFIKTPEEMYKGDISMSGPGEVVKLKKGQLTTLNVLRVE